MPGEVLESALPILSVVIPTRNEASNIEPLVRRLASALKDLGGGWELVFVDDSDDTTPDTVEHLASETDFRITLLHRWPGQRDGGLGGAVKLGFSKASGRVIAVMDADLQHPPEIVPALVSPVLSGQWDLAVGNRYGFLGGRDGLSGPLRRVIAISCRFLAHRLVPNSRAISDPMSGLFALERSVVDRAQLRPEGYKILLEVVARGDWHRATNVDYRFDERYSGQSKARLAEGLVFLRHLWHLWLVSRSKEGPSAKASAPGTAKEGLN